MSRYDGLIIPRSYSEYINKTDAATLQQALQLSGVLSEAVAAGDNKAVKSSAVNSALTNYINKTDAATLQQALQLPGVLSEAVAAGENKAVKSSAVYEALTSYINKTDAATLQQALQLPGVLSEAVAAGDNKAVTSNAVNGAFASYPVIISNDNGIAYKFPSGFLICTKQVSIDLPVWNSWGALYETDEINLGKWPYNFMENETPRVQASVVGPYGGFTSTVKGVTNLITGTTSILRANAVNTTMYVDIIGIGRWK